MTKRKDVVKSDIAKFREDLERTDALDEVLTVIIKAGGAYAANMKQGEWSRFVYSINEWIAELAQSIYFVGYTGSNESVRGAAWIFDIVHDNSELLKRKLSRIKKKYDQEIFSVIGTDRYVY